MSVKARDTKPPMTLASFSLERFGARGLASHALRRAGCRATLLSLAHSVVHRFLRPLLQCSGSPHWVRLGR
jgi:hypothetical protein